jgi:predicted TIM-barrel fold metal-dependent hydrolase
VSVRWRAEPGAKCHAWSRGAASSVYEAQDCFAQKHFASNPVAIRAALDFLGPEHVLMGSDVPYIAPANHVAVLTRLQLPAQENALLLGGNARRLLGLSGVGSSA